MKNDDCDWFDVLKLYLHLTILNKLELLFAFTMLFKSVCVNYSK